MEKISQPYMLNIGEVKVIKGQEEMLWTVLGSCVSVIFHCPGKLSVVCHAQMPDRGKYDRTCSDHCPHPCFNNQSDSNDFKFVNCSLEYMLKILRDNRIDFRKIHTSLLGGAMVLHNNSPETSIGYLNLQTARKVLETNGITIDRELSGGLHGITLWYHHQDNRLIYRLHDSQEKVEFP